MQTLVQKHNYNSYITYYSIQCGASVQGLRGLIGQHKVEYSQRSRIRSRNTRNRVHREDSSGFIRQTVS